MDRDEIHSAGRLEFDFVCTGIGEGGGGVLQIMRVLEYSYANFISAYH